MRYIILLVFIMGCSRIVQKIDTVTNYSKDVPFYVNGIPFRGVGVTKKSDKYQIDIRYPYGEVNVLTLRTCHREIKLETETNKASYTFVPSDVEKEDECELEISVFDKKSRNGWGLLQFERDNAKLTANVECNGDNVLAKGIYICQGKIQTIQRISFLNDVTLAIAPEDVSRCSIDGSGRQYTFTISPGFCYYTFQDAKGDYLELTVYGYQNFIIRN